MARWHRLKSEYLIKRWWMNLRVDHVRLPNGQELDEYHVLEYPDWVCVVCLTEDRKVVLVEQYRYGIDDVTLELPGGAIDPGEDPAAAARRELREETGYDAEEMIYVGKVAPDPTRHTNYAWLYVAKGAKWVGDQNLDPGEMMQVQTLPIDEALAEADRGGITHGIHLAALFWAGRKGHLNVDPD